MKVRKKLCRVSGMQRRLIMGLIGRAWIDGDGLDETLNFSDLVDILGSDSNLKEKALAHGEGLLLSPFGGRTSCHEPLTPFKKATSIKNSQLRNIQLWGVAYRSLVSSFPCWVAPS